MRILITVITGWAILATAPAYYAHRTVRRKAEELKRGLS